MYHEGHRNDHLGALMPDSQSPAARSHARWDTRHRHLDRHGDIKASSNPIAYHNRSQLPRCPLACSPDTSWCHRHSSHTVKVIGQAGRESSKSFLRCETLRAPVGRGATDNTLCLGHKEHCQSGAARARTRQAPCPTCTLNATGMCSGATSVRHPDATTIPHHG